MLVAEGAAEIGLDPEATLWDMAAAKVIVEEAGGRFTDLRGAATADGGNGAGEATAWCTMPRSSSPVGIW